MRREGRRVYKLGLGQSPFPIPSEVVNALRLHAHEDAYLPVTGLPALREAVAEFHRQKDRVRARPEGVLVGPGSKELLFLLQLTFYGELLVPSPSLGVLHPAGSYHRSHRQSYPDGIRRELAGLPLSVWRPSAKPIRTGRVFSY